MNRNRINQMRQMDRGQEGLQQVIQIQRQQGQLGNQHNQQNQGPAPTVQTVRRKTTYTRTEMLSRGLPTVHNTNRSARNCATAGQDWSSQMSPKQRYTQPPKAVIPVIGPLVQSTNATNTTNATNKSSTLGRQRSFLPRVARLPNKADKSPSRTQNRVARTTELPVEQSKQPVGNHKGVHLMNNTPHDSDSSMLATSGDNLISESSSSMEHHKIKLAKAIRLPDDQNKSFVYVCKPVKKVKALMTARRLRTSTEHLNGLKEGEFCLQNEETYKLQRSISEEAIRSKGAGEGYTLTPVEGLAQTSSTSSQLDSPTLAAMLQRQQQFEAKAVCSQERLRIQLREVRQRQRQLRQLERDQCEREQRQLELDQMCQNLPALQHEIHMLQQLSEKLEATIRVSSIPKPRSTVIIADISQQSSGRFYTPRTSPYQLNELPLRKLGCLRVEQMAVIQLRARNMGTVCHVGLVQEFRIETKTLNELKTADESQCFYLPVPKVEPALTAANEADPLQPTNFRKLRENPNMLLQQLRQVPGTARPFNLLDQDTMFFNSLAYADPKTLAANSAAGQLEMTAREMGGGAATLAHYGHGAIAYSRLSVRVNEVGVAPTAAVKTAEQGDRLTGAIECPIRVNNTTQTDVRVPRLGKLQLETETEISSSHPSPRLIKRKKLEEVRAKVRGQDVREPDPGPRPMQTRNTMRRRAPEPPIRCRVEPKVRLKLFKTVLVGMVQVAVILVLIMAFTYPDVSC
ncbi:uncharacterized protein LOC113564485 [Drosophila erecta]|uniref:uncharacterized protein LOC113564485 n=1 Tax=Drosophila erecta TaxID=7220 RepID=UPI00017811C0|nr:uncharacterized protein LOC113564485 [Drosophila erecta]